MGLKVQSNLLFPFETLSTLVAFEFSDFIVNDFVLLQIFFRCKFFPAIGARILQITIHFITTLDSFIMTGSQRNLQNEIVFVVVRQSVLLVDLDVSKSQTTNSANQQQKIIMSGCVICNSICSKKLDPFFTNETFNSSSHSG
jgi:hypothetical protein